MEPRQSEKLVESQGEEQSSPPRPPDRKCRFQIIKLEERVAPCGGHHGQGQCTGNPCNNSHKCY